MTQLGCSSLMQRDMTKSTPSQDKELRSDTTNNGDGPWCDVLVVGAGPAGLTAAIYLARFRRNVVVIDSGYSRALRIPTTHNYPGFPAGISGRELMQRLQEQALRYGVRVRRGTVDLLSTTEGGFIAVADNTRFFAKRVLLATGVVDIAPPMEGLEEATMSTSLRWCPICDGFEAIDQKIAILSDASKGPAHALFLRTYTADVTLVLDGSQYQISNEARDSLQAAGVQLVEGTVVQIRSRSEVGVSIALRSGEVLNFDVLYPMLGSVAQDQLGTTLGARCCDGELLVDEHQQTSASGLYAAGDVVKALNQMSVGVGHAAIAATAIHNSLNSTGTSSKAP